MSYDYSGRIPDDWQAGRHVNIELTPESAAKAVAERRQVIEALIAEHPDWDLLEIHDAMVAQTGSGAATDEIRTVMNQRR